MIALYTAVLYLFVALFGACVGSFLNVVIYRCPRRESIVTGASHCTSCGRPLLRRDLVPILSYLALGGKCRFCGQRISPRYPLVEGWNTVLWLLCAWRLGFTLKAALACACVSCLIVICMVDWDTQEIMDSTILFLLALGLLSFLDPALLWWERLLGAVVISLPMLLVALLTGGFGGGDIKLMAAAGLLLGWRSTLLAALIAAVTGAAYALIQMKRGKLDRKSFMPFGPFLAVGIMVALLFGTQLIEGYLSLLR
jgi:leader peptidase (prepilin peptidase)/N-methyltransferase